jgi:hypothetical protein
LWSCPSAQKGPAAWPYVLVSGGLSCGAPLSVSAGALALILAKV